MLGSKCCSRLQLLIRGKIDCTLYALIASLRVVGLIPLVATTVFSVPVADCCAIFGAQPIAYFVQSALHPHRQCHDAHAVICSVSLPPDFAFLPLTTAPFIRLLPSLPFTMPAFMAFSVFFSFFLGIFSAIGVGASETHTIKFINQCGRGTPCLVVNAQNVSTGQDYVVNGIFSAIAYLQTGECNVNGEECTLLEMNLANPTCPGCGSSVDISLIDPHRFNVETSFAYYNGCDGFGADCNSPSCTAAFYAPEDWYAQRQCEADNVNLLIAFCANASEIISGGSVPSASSSSTVLSTSLPSTTAISTGTTLSSSATSQKIPPTTTSVSGTLSSTGSSYPSSTPKKCQTRPNSSSTLARREATGLVAKMHRQRRSF